jgi:hypothetical protein
LYTVYTLHDDDDHKVEVLCCCFLRLLLFGILVMDNKKSSKFVSKKSDGARSAAAVSKFGRKKRRKLNDDGDDDSTDDEQEHTSRRAKQQERPSNSRAKTENASGTTKQNTGDSTYRDRAKERREGIKNATTAEQQEDFWLSPTAPSDAASTDEEEATTTTTTTTKPIEATPQHLSLHRAYYTFGTQWNPWWERPVVNTFLDDGSSSSRHSNRRPWEPFSAEILDKVRESCRRIAQREAERQKRAVAVSKGRDDDANTKKAEVANQELSDDDDDIFAGAGDYDAAVAIQETAPTNHDVATSAALGGGGASIFGVVAKNHYHLHHDASALPEPKPEGDDGAMRPLHGFSETVDTTAGVDMDYEIADVDPKKKKKKKRRKKGDDADSD